MKKAFPGDPEYSWDRFYQLPYEYVLLGYYKLAKMKQEELHAYEMPIALNTAVYANSQRDPKSNKKAFGPMDFALYKPLEGEGPDGYYAACYLKALEKKQLPMWALFCYKSVAPSARGAAGVNYALIAEDVILVGHRKTDSGFKGLLIAMESASDQDRDFRDQDGNVYTLRVPTIGTKVIAKEDVTLS